LKNVEERALKKSQDEREREREEKIATGIKVESDTCVILRISTTKVYNTILFELV